MAGRAAWTPQQIDDRLHVHVVHRVGQSLPLGTRGTLGAGVLASASPMGCVGDNRALTLLGLALGPALVMAAGAGGMSARSWATAGEMAAVAEGLPGLGRAPGARADADAAATLLLCARHTAYSQPWYTRRNGDQADRVRSRIRNNFIVRPVGDACYRVR